MNKISFNDWWKLNESSLNPHCRHIASMAWRAALVVGDNKEESIQKLSQEKKNIKNEKRRKAIRKLEEKSKIYCENELRVGDVVKFAGTRDKHGYRLIEAIDHDGYIVGRKLVARPFRITRDRSNNLIKYDLNRNKPFLVLNNIKFDLGYEMTQHGSDKIRIVYKLSDMVIPFNNELSAVKGITNIIKI